MKIFISASSNNYLETNFLVSKLKEINREDDITFWYADNANVPVGSSLDDILNNISESEGAIILVSNDFLESSFILQKELPAILKKTESDKNYKLIPVLIDEDTNFENFEDVSLEKIKYVNSKKTSLKGLGESEAYVLCNNIMQEITSINSGKSSKEVNKIIKRIELLNIMFETISNEYEGKRYNLAERQIASGGLSDLYSSSLQRWGDTLLRYKRISKETLHEIKNFDTLTQKRNILEQKDYKKLEMLINKINNFLSKIDESIEKACKGWKCFDSIEEAGKVKKEGPRGETESAFKCLLCNYYHVGLDLDEAATHPHDLNMDEVIDDLKDYY